MGRRKGFVFMLIKTLTGKVLYFYFKRATFVKLRKCRHVRFGCVSRRKRHRQGGRSSQAYRIHSVNVAEAQTALCLKLPLAARLCLSSLT